MRNALLLLFGIFNLASGFLPVLSRKKLRMVKNCLQFQSLYWKLEMAKENCLFLNFFFTPVSTLEYSDIRARSTQLKWWCSWWYLFFRSSTLCWFSSERFVRIFCTNRRKMICFMLFAKFVCVKRQRSGCGLRSNCEIEVCTMSAKMFAWITKQN